MPEPIIRHIALQPISHEHHHGLKLSWKIRQGLKLAVDPERIKKYTDWFWQHNLKSHFDFEEIHIFPILGNNHPSVKRALREHSRLKKIIHSADQIEKNLSLLEEELVAHIRFEERVLFNEAEAIATAEQLEKISQAHSVVVCEDWPDKFWQ